MAHGLTPARYLPPWFLWLQIALALGFSLLAWMLKGEAPALSVVAGAAITLTGSLAYKHTLSRVDGSGPGKFLLLLFVAEIAKLLGMSVVVAMLYLWCRQLEWLWVLAGCLSTYSAYWFGLLIKN